MEKKKLSEREKMIEGFKKRIVHKRRQLAEARKFHRGVERELERKIQRDVMQMNALKRTK